jgi:hypothetical protein
MQTSSTSSNNTVMFPANITTRGEKTQQGISNYLLAAAGRSSPYWEVDLWFRKQTTSTINVPACVCVCTILFATWLLYEGERSDSNH